MSVLRRFWFLGAGGLALMSLVAASGCTQRKTTPELEYSQSEVQTIRDEIEKIDWE